ncbi:MAG: hypothetical protein PHW04_18190 [Candidatus Wallbacteria bacterium]|nr:hypothetical protein [Candidatus Wallbacteria bacterium]
MCVAMVFVNRKSGREYRSFFTDPGSRIVYLERGNAGLASWGIRSTLEHPELKLPVGGWAREESIAKGTWKKYHPEEVLIPAVKFLERDWQKKIHLFELSDRESIKGLLVREGSLAVVYVITIESPPELRQIHTRWVKITELPGGGLPDLSEIVEQLQQKKVQPENLTLW